jgi:hypothetical protein
LKSLYSIWGQQATMTVRWKAGTPCVPDFLLLSAGAGRRTVIVETLPIRFVANTMNR